MANLGELAARIAKDACDKLVCLPDVTAVCITMVGARELPLGWIVYQPKQDAHAVTIDAIARLSDHIETLTRILKELEGKHGVDGDGQNRAAVGGAQGEQSQPDRGADTAGDEDTIPHTPST